ncbi:MAG: ABC transporter permease [Chthonomonas sp.]|nr:ABC transporter permease [Chthonomonas sp.]
MSGKLIALALGCFAVLIGALMLAGVVPADAFSALMKGSFGSPTAISRTLKETTPLLIAGVAVFIALQAGLFNIGVEGQLLVGACTAVAIALKIPTPVGMVLAVLGAMAAGALWALPAGLIRVFRGGHEVISTIMLNNIALFLTQYLVVGPLRSLDTESQTTANVSPGVMIPNILVEPFKLNTTLVLALLLVIGFAIWFKRSVAGYELRASGANATAAAFAGISVDKIRLRSMVVSGAIAGFAGASMVLAYEGRFYPNFSPGYGFDGLGVALLSGSSPFGLIPAALGFGVLASGGTQLSLMGIPKGVSGLLLGLLIIVFAAYRYREVNRG